MFVVAWKELDGHLHFLGHHCFDERGVD